MVANLKLIFSYLKLNIRKEAQYKMSFALKIVMMFLNNLFFIVQWVIIFKLIPSVGGYNFSQVMFIWAISAMSFGIAHIFFNGAFKLSHYIYNGKLDVFLCQPKNLLLNIACSSTSISAIGDLLYGIVICLIFASHWWWIFPMILFAILGALIYASMYVVYVSFTFFITRGWAVAEAFDHMFVATSLYPMRIFSGAAKVILFTFVPVVFVSFIPLETLLQFNIWYVLAAIGATALSLVLAFGCFKLGIKRYGSSSVMSARD